MVSVRTAAADTAGEYATQAVQVPSSWRSASVLYPFVNNDRFDRSAGSLTRIAMEGTVTVDVFDWMGMYKASVVRGPQLFPDEEELTQVRNNLLLTFQYTLIDRKKGIEEMKKASELEKAQREKADAEKKAQEAEDRAKELERELEQQRKIQDADAELGALEETERQHAAAIAEATDNAAREAAQAELEKTRAAIQAKRAELEVLRQGRSGNAP